MSRQQTRARLREQLVPGLVVRFRGRQAVVLHQLAGKSSYARVRYRDGREATVRRCRDVVLGPAACRALATRRRLDARRKGSDLTSRYGRA
jgi:hypothetical protein